MYRGFNLKGFDRVSLAKIAGDCGGQAVIGDGRLMQAASSRLISAAVNRLDSKGDAINGDVLEAAWFPQIECDVFISHSHADRDLALALSGALKKCFGLKAFVDSCVWGCRDQLIEKIRELSGNAPTMPCRNHDDEIAVVSHADMMLNCSLLRMIDSCECLMFIDTSKSVDRRKLSDKTFSAWLYSEITISKFIRKRTPERRKGRYQLLNEGLTSAMDSFALKVEHGMDRNHLMDLTPDGFASWVEDVKERKLSGRMALDPLYDCNNEQPKFVV